MLKQKSNAVSKNKFGQPLICFNRRKIYWKTFLKSEAHSQLHCVGFEVVGEI